MGIFGKKEDAVLEQAPVVEEVKPVQPKAAAGTIIAEGVTFIGDFVTDEDMDIQGAVKGDIKSTVTMHLAKNGQHIGKLDAQNINIEGYLEANATVKDTACFSDSSTFKGNLVTANIDAAHGSNFEGSLSIKKDQPAKASPLFEDGDVAVTAEDIFGKA